MLMDAPVPGQFDLESANGEGPFRPVDGGTGPLESDDRYPAQPGTLTQLLGRFLITTVPVAVLRFTVPLL